MKSKLDNYKRLLNKDMFVEYNNINLNLSMLDHHIHSIKKYENDFEQKQIKFEEKYNNLNNIINKLIIENNNLINDNKIIIEKNNNFSINFDKIIIENKNLTDIINNDKNKYKNENDNILKPNDFIKTLKIQDELINVQLKFENKIEKNFFNLEFDIQNIENKIKKLENIGIF